MNNTTRLEKLETAQAARLNRASLSGADLANDLAAIIHCGRLPSASHVEFLMADELCQIFEEAAARKAAAERQENV